MEDDIVQAGHGPGAPKDKRPGARWVQMWVDEYKEQGFDDIRIIHPSGQPISVEELNKRAQDERSIFAAQIVDAPRGTCRRF